MNGQVFAGRKQEQKQFDGVLRDPRGQVIVIICQQGMGKTLLANQLADLAVAHPEFSCGAVRYTVTPDETADSLLELMIEHAYEAARTESASFSVTSPPTITVCPSGTSICPENELVVRGGGTPTDPLPVKLLKLKE